MQKKWFIINLSILFFFLTSLNATSNRKQITAFLDQKIVISPHKLGPGIWQLTHYNRKIVELIEDTKEPFSSFIFRAINVGNGEVELKYIENNKLAKKVKYTIKVTSKKSRSDRKKNNRNNKFHLMLNSKSKYFNKQKKNFYRTKRKRKPKKVTYSLPEREIMKSGNIFYIYIKTLCERKLYHQAILEIDKYHLLYPHHIKINKINLLKGKIFIQFKQYQEAIAWYKRLIEENKEPLSKKGQLIILLGKTYEKMNDLENTKLSYVKILTLIKDPNILAETHFNLGKLYFKEKKYKKGILELESIVKKYPEANKTREICLFLLGEMYYKKSSLRNYKKAHQYFRVLIEEFPDKTYSIKAKEKMKYLEQNFIKYF